MSFSKNHAKIETTESNSIEQFPGKSYKTPFRSSEIFLVSIHSFEKITDYNERKVYELRFSRSDVSYDFEPGDTIGIIPENSEEVVNKLLLRLGHETNSLNSKESINLKRFLTSYADLNSIPKKIFLKKLQTFVKDPKEREELSRLCSKEGSSDYMKFIGNRSECSFQGILNKFASCFPSDDFLIDNLPQLLPRPYSISSSPLNNEFISITFNVINEADGGVCSSFLERKIDENSPIQLFFRNSNSKFKLPLNDEVPIILIATGTGIAPFKSFLEHRHLQRKSEDDFNFGFTWLIYGCRDALNFLYKNELEKYLKSKTLSKLTAALSRELETKIYVQDKIRENSVEFFELINDKGAIVYVCGKQKVLDDVKTAIIEVLETAGCSRENANHLVGDLVKNNKFLVDNWGI